MWLISQAHVYTRSILNPGETRNCESVKTSRKLYLYRAKSQQNHLKVDCIIRNEEWVGRWEGKDEEEEKATQCRLVGPAAEKSKIPAEVQRGHEDPSVHSYNHSNDPDRNTEVLKFRLDKGSLAPSQSIAHPPAPLLRALFHFSTPHQKKPFVHSCCFLAPSFVLHTGPKFPRRWMCKIHSVHSSFKCTISCGFWRWACVFFMFL